jgi:hypothetical protein
LGLADLVDHVAEGEFQRLGEVGESSHAPVVIGEKR